MNKSLNLISLLILIFTTIGCDKDDFELGSPVVGAKQDSLLCKMWLYNARGDTTNVFREGEDIHFGFYLQSFKKEEVWIYADFTPDDLDMTFYRSDGSYVGTPFGLYITKDRYTLLTNLEPIKGSFINIGELNKLNHGERMSKGEYYLTLQYKTTLIRFDTTYVNGYEVRGNVDFPQMRFNFKIQ